MITLGDQPRMSPEAIRRVIAARADGVDAVRATYAGSPGHPVLLERAAVRAHARRDAATTGLATCC